MRCSGAAGLLALAVTVALLGGPRGARADERELAVHLEAGPAGARVEDVDGHGATALMPGLRMGARVSYGLTDHVAVEAHVGGLLGAGADFDGVEAPSGAMGSLHVTEHAVRGTAGATVRLGVEWIPTASAFVGVQRRIVTNAFYTPAVFGSEVDASGYTDVVVGLGLGHDVRFDAHWVAGVQAQLVHAVSLDGNAFTSLEVPIHVAWYFYP